MRILPLLTLCACLTDAEWQGRVDADGDGHPAWEDCDDTNPDLSPADEDGDGLSTCDGDCNDADPAIQLGGEYWADLDGDDYGSGEPVTACAELAGFTERDGDCAPEDAASYPGAPEVWYDGVDQACDGGSDFDQDSDGDDDAAQGGGTDCDDVDPTVNGLDVDEDGHSLCDGDCDDADPSLTPVDADADGASSCAGDCARTWARDGDGDGFGAEAGQLVQCADPSTTLDGWIEAGPIDCDDADPAVHPAAVEQCTGVDDDCDDLIDDADPDVSGAPSWYSDADADDYGDDGDTVVQCLDPSTTGAAWVLLGGDCEPGDGSINPGVDEACGDRVDNDCDGLVDFCPTPDHTPTAFAEGGTEDGRLGAAVLLHDIDADGVGELIVGEPGKNYVLWFDIAGGPPPLIFPPGSGDATLDGRDGAGAAIVVLGDVDGDGLDDVAVGAPLANEGAGTVSVLSSGAMLGAIPMDSITIATLLGPLTGAAGAVLASGDLDGDGLADLLIGLPSDAGPPPSDTPDKGIAFGFFSTSLLDFGEADIPRNEDVAFALCASAGERCGASLSLGDLDGDGLAEVMVGAPGVGDGAGAVYGLVGSPGLFGPIAPDDRDFALTGVTPGDGAGAPVRAVGDIDGDGRTDVAVGAPSASDEAGVVYVLGSEDLLAPGDPPGMRPDIDLADATWRFDGTAGQQLGFAMAGLGRVGPAPGGMLALGAPGAAGDDGVVVTLTPSVLGGGMFGAEAAADLLFLGEAGERLGEVVEAAGDADGNGAGDLLLGRPLADSGLGVADAGVAELILLGERL
jgi:hypothetical protein